MTDELKQWEYDRGYDRGYEQGKADARKKVLAEFKNIWNERVKDLINWCKDIRLIGLQQADSIFDEIVEQLKEQTNGKDINVTTEKGGEE